MPFALTHCGDVFKHSNDFCYLSSKINSLTKNAFSLLPIYYFDVFISECSIYVSSCFQVNESIDPLSAQFFMRLIIVWFSVLFIENVESVRYYNKLKIKELAPFGSCWTFFPLTQH